MELTLWPLIGLLLAGGMAGMIDAVVGGGGLIQIPALFSACPGQAPATLFGTNKAASILGTGSAALRYARQVRLSWHTLLPAMVAAFVMAFVGAAAVAWLPVAVLRPVMLVLLVTVAVYVFLRPDLGQVHAPRAPGSGHQTLAVLCGGAVGFYDGFFGPGTGSVLIFLFIRGFGLDFLHASASAKWVNVTTNFAALAYFIPHGHWLPWLALGMAACNVAGAILGIQFALRYGNRAVRIVFLIVLTILIGRFGWDTVTLYL